MILCNRFRFGIGHVNDVVLVNEDAARPAKLEPLVDVVALLVENLDTVIAAIGEKESRARIHREGMGNLHLARTGALLSPGLDELAVLVELDDACISVSAMSIGEKDVAIRRNEHSRWRDELVGTTAIETEFAVHTEYLAARHVLS